MWTQCITAYARKLVLNKREKRNEIDLSYEIRVDLRIKNNNNRAVS